MILSPTLYLELIQISLCLQTIHCSLYRILILGPTQRLSSISDFMELATSGHWYVEDNPFACQLQGHISDLPSIGMAICEPKCANHHASFISERVERTGSSIATEVQGCSAATG